MVFAKVEQLLSCSMWVGSVEGLDRVRLLRREAHLTGREEWRGVDPQRASNGRNLDALRSSTHFLRVFSQLRELLTSPSIRFGSYENSGQRGSRRGPRASSMRPPWEAQMPRRRR